MRSIQPLRVGSKAAPLLIILSLACAYAQLRVAHTLLRSAHVLLRLKQRQLSSKGKNEIWVVDIMVEECLLHHANLDIFHPPASCDPPPAFTQASSDQNPSSTQVCSGCCSRVKRNCQLLMRVRHEDGKRQTSCAGRCKAGGLISGRLR
jgi:hypothetical protein